MIKKILEDGKQFHFNQKETYTFDDVKNIIGQHQHFVIKQGEEKIQEKLNLLEGDLATANSAKEEFANSEKEIKDALETFKTENEKLSNDLKPFKELEVKNKSKELLKGLVVDGAEYDAYNNLDLEGIEFTDEDTLETKQEKIKDKVEKLIEVKPYLKPIEESIENDEPEVTNFKVGDKKPEKKYTGANAIRING